MDVVTVSDASLSTPYFMAITVISYTVPASSPDIVAGLESDVTFCAVLGSAPGSWEIILKLSASWSFQLTLIDLVSTALAVAPVGVLGSAGRLL